MSFNTPIDRRNTNSTKWDLMEKFYGVSAEDGLAMWTADSDYATAPCVIAAVHDAAQHGVFGYRFEYKAYLDAVVWWMKTRHDWEIQPDWVLTTQGLGNAIALSINVWIAERCSRNFFSRLSRVRPQNRKGGTDGYGMPIEARRRHVCA